jgi:hypothetical protein
MKFYFHVLHPGILPKLLFSAIKYCSITSLILQCDKNCEHVYTIQNRDFTSTGVNSEAVANNNGITVPSRSVLET